jgi:uncharacterized lipoprotein YajG
MRIIVAIAAVSLAAACGQTTTVEDDTPDTTIVETQTPNPPTVIVLSEQDARSRIESAGYTEVTGLTQNADGTWSATASRDGASTTLTVNDRGVSVTTTP